MNAWEPSYSYSFFGYLHSWSIGGSLQGSSPNPYVRRLANIVWETVLSRLVFYKASLTTRVIVDDLRLAVNDVI